MNPVLPATFLRALARRAGVHVYNDHDDTLYASGATSLITNTGRRQPDLMLGDVLGAALEQADWTDREHYVTPTEACRPNFPDWDTKYPACVRGPTMDVRPLSGATVRAASVAAAPDTAARRVTVRDPVRR